ncbi:MAG: hypothetical protein ABSF95_10975 [Verrucomicrobiota bacterium]|jgi:hypothetical protein
MEIAGKQLDPSQIESREAFGAHVRNVQAAIIHTYALIAHASVQETSAEAAAALWKGMVELCEDALKVLWKLKSLYPNCGTPELYDLTLDYRQEAEERYHQNLEDSQCQTPVPAGLFPNKN